MHPFWLALLGAGKAPPIPIGLSAVSAWLRVAGGTVTGAGYSSIPDIMAAGGNPATQGTDAMRPPAATSANGLPLADFQGNDVLSWPAAAGNNATAAWGIAFWVTLDSVAAGTRSFMTITPGGGTSKVEVMQTGADLLVDVYHSDFVMRRGTVAASLSTGTPLFITGEFFGGGAADADKWTFTIGGVVQTVAFTDSGGAPGAMPTAMIATAGPLLIGARTSGAAGGLDGRVGPNVWILGSRMAGATQGLLTTAGRAALMGLEAPT